MAKVFLKVVGAGLTGNIEVPSVSTTVKELKEILAVRLGTTDTSRCEYSQEEHLCRLIVAVSRVKRVKSVKRVKRVKRSS
eukprot:1180431-Prorocentrum_minimum.AAC.4